MNARDILDSKFSDEPGMRYKIEGSEAFDFIFDLMWEDISNVDIPFSDHPLFKEFGDFVKWAVLKTDSALKEKEVDGWGGGMSATGGSINIEYLDGSSKTLDLSYETFKRETGRE